MRQPDRPTGASPAPPRRIAGAPVALLAVAVLAVGGWAVATATSSAQNGDALTIITDTGRHVFDVEWALSREEQACGLMFRDEMAEDHGMVFDFGTDRDVSFWMRNTYISLDMVFITGDGVVLAVAERTPTLSDAPIPSGGPVRYVLEVVAGTADSIGLEAGDIVELERPEESTSVCYVALGQPG